MSATKGRSWALFRSQNAVPRCVCKTPGIVLMKARYIRMIYHLDPTCDSFNLAKFSITQKLHHSMENTHVKAKTNQKFGIQFKVTVDSCNTTEVLQVEV